jgi:hypothetical protein
MTNSTTEENISVLSLLDFIDELTDQWLKSNKEIELRSYLKMSYDQFTKWELRPNEILRILGDTHPLINEFKKNKRIEE